VIDFPPSLTDLIIFLTLTRLVVVINFVNFSFALFTPPLGDFHLAWCKPVHTTWPGEGLVQPSGLLCVT
jgi:hypothetical protein